MYDYHVTITSELWAFSPSDFRLSKEYRDFSR